jgi:hypothetical protein
MLADEAKARANTLDERTRLWAQVISEGTVLSWKHPRGGIVTLGPYQCAVPDSFRRYALLSKWGDRFFSEAWSAAVIATTYVGRQLPREASHA